MIQSIKLRSRLVSLLIFLMLGTSSQLEANWFVFGAIGSDYYQGDVSETALPSLRTLRLNYGLGVGYFFNFRWSARLRYMKGAFHGSDAYFSNPLIQARGITFDNSFWDVGLHMQYHHLFKKSYKLINYGLVIYRFRAGGNPSGVFDPSKLNNVDCPKFGY